MASKPLPLSKQFSPDFANKTLEVPVNPVAIDWDSSLSKGLEAYFIPYANSFLDVVTGRYYPGTVNPANATPSFNQGGRVISSTDDHEINIGDRDKSSSDSYSFTWLAAKTTPTAVSGMVCGDVNTTDNFLWMANTDGDVWLQHTNSSGQLNFSIPSVTHDMLVWRTVTIKGTSGTYYADGLSDTDTSASSPLVLNSMMAGYATNTFDFAGDYQGLIIHNRELSKSEVIELHKSPKEACLKPVTPPIYFIPGAAVANPFPLQLPKQFSPDFAIPLRPPVSAQIIDFSNPLTRGMRMCVMQTAKGITELITGDIPASGLGTPTDTIARLGRARNYNVSSDFFTTPSALDSVSEYTWAVHSECIDFASWGFGGFFAKNSNLGDNVGFHCFRSGSTLFIDNGGGVQQNTGLGPTELNGEHVLSCVWNGATVETYLDSALADTSTMSRVPTSGAGYAKILSNRNSESSIGKHYLTVVWDRALSKGEILAFNANPYQILKPVTPPHYFIPGEALEFWTGIINGVLNPARINGILVANIIKVNDVASS